MIPVPPLRKILSPGDVLIGLGGAAAVATAMRKILSPGDVLIGLGGAAAVATAMRRRENMAEADASAPVEKAAVPG